MSTFQRLHIALEALRELGPVQLGLYVWYQLGLRTGYLRWRTPGGGRGGEVVRERDTGSQFDLWPVLSALPDRAELAATLGESGVKYLLSEADEILAGQVRLFGGEPRPLRLAAPGALRHWTEYELGSGGGEERRSRGAGEQGSRGGGERRSGEEEAIWRRGDGVRGRQGNGATGQRGEAAKMEEQDVKLVWEPGRFGWAYTLARAYHLNGNECYAEAFWHYTETFLDANPPNLGPHWASAQEVALRLIAFVFAAQVFVASPHSTPERLRRLGQAIAWHAARIPPTLAYARAQNNNHLLTEAAGLIIAGLALPNHPASARWQKLGRRWFDHALQTQIAADGTYVQHSTNYHRLMLQVALWVYGLWRIADGESANWRISESASRRPFNPQSEICNPQSAIRNLKSAIHWLLALLDPESGRVPNLGPNDGAYILPLTICPFEDYRPVLQAASLYFLGERAFPPGPWDEMALWLGDGRQRTENIRPPESTIQNLKSKIPSPYSILRMPSINSWAYLRAVQFRSRPGHADQLHLDLWWRGLNIAQDAGTYLYNAPPPWDNSLARSEVHNTLTVNDCDPMTRAGRFLWLDWAQGQILSRKKAEDGSWERLTAQHDGYCRLGVIHQRAVTAFRDGDWVIEDRLLQDSKSAIRNLKSKIQNPKSKIRLHWLLPDWPWELREMEDAGLEIRLHSPYGWIILRTRVNLQSEICNLKSQITRAGELLYGSGPASPIWGWVSSTYGEKRPALSFAVVLEGSPPLTLLTEWNFPDDQ